MAWNGNGSDIRVLEEPTVGNIAAIDSNGSVRRPPSQLMQDEQDDDEEDDDEDKSSVEPSTPTPTTTKTKENTSTILTTTSTTTARQKQPIKYIENKTRRHVTFSKRRHGIMKKAYELSVLTGANILLLILANSGLVYTFTTPKLEPLVREDEGKNLIKACINAPDAPPTHDQPATN
ncbi:hypothetical protein N7582_004353 [Saccharomyces uvarum]|uniref:MADS-box domain-containing protein n=1 Tax=Saccharomyces uvarum TaxID=230603 RepID=A0AA35NLH8_SACUV|nr:hypothetical protein N7582_004353 [Saccharomyces uvarum]CAI4048340.1 hypothetical protein SUVC_13G1790 [Saccharomyces uvarum]